MADNIVSDTSSDNNSGETKGKMLMIAFVIVSAIPLIIGYWAAQTGGGFN